MSSRRYNFRSQAGKPSRARPIRRGERRRGRLPPGQKLRDYRSSAKSRLKRFRRGSALAVGITAVMMLVWVRGPDAGAAEGESANGEDPVDVLPTDPGVSLEQATDTVQDLLLGFYGMLPRVIIALALILVALLLARAVRFFFERSLGRWERQHALSALVQIGIFLFAIGAALSVLAGDARALVGSIGLVGLALSWALQTPIESFTGWLMNSFRGYYRVGDRIEVGSVFGDVYRIDVLTTTVWEAGGPGKAVAGAQPTGAMITIPNWEVLRSNVVNYSREFPFVWDEVTILVAAESDLSYTVTVLERVAERLLGMEMVTPVREYQQLLERARLSFEVEEKPRAFVSLAETGAAACTVRYLILARRRRRCASNLTIGLMEEIAKSEHAGKIIVRRPK